jgi:stage II sporulation protein D
MPRHRHAVRALTGALTTVVVALAAVVGPAAGSASAAVDSWRVPARATVVVPGHGYGHGHGLSQYGAQRAARQGLGYRRIVDFYYPGTRWGRAARKVSVLISADTSEDLVVDARSRLTLRSRGSGQRWRLAQRNARLWRIEPASRGRSAVSYKTRRWHPWRVVPGDAEFSAGGSPIRLRTPAGAVRYRGVLRSASPAGSPTTRDTVNVLPLDNYLRGVLPREVPALWHPHAVRAQAVAARTYAAYERAHPIARHYQICDTSHCQVYGGASAEHPAADDAVRTTARQILTKRGAPAFAQFSASSGGWTSAGGFSYLPARRDPYDAWSGNPYHSWRTSLDDRAIERQWPRLGNLTRIRITRRDGHGDWGGRVERLALTGDAGSGTTVRMSGDTFRLRLGLRSTWFTFRVAR